MCQSIIGSLRTIARERVAEEFMKWAVKSSRPGRIAEYLAASGWDVHFPEIARLAGVPQDPALAPGRRRRHPHHVCGRCGGAHRRAREPRRRRSRRAAVRGACATISPKPPPPQLREREGKTALDLLGTRSRRRSDGARVPRTDRHQERDRRSRRAAGGKSSGQFQHRPRSDAARRPPAGHAPGAGDHHRSAALDRSRLLRSAAAARGLPEGAMRIREMAEAQAVASWSAAAADSGTACAAVL